MLLLCDFEKLLIITLGWCEMAVVFWGTCHWNPDIPLMDIFPGHISQTSPLPDNSLLFINMNINININIAGR